MHRFWKFFHWCLPDICANNFAAGSFRSEKLHSRLLSFETGKTHFSRFFHVSDPPIGGKGSSWGADFGVVGKPIPTFLIAVHWSHFDISVRFLTNRLNIAKKRDFCRGGHFDAKYIGQTSENSVCGFYNACKAAVTRIYDAWSRRPPASASHCDSCATFLSIFFTYWYLSII